MNSTIWFLVYSIALIDFFLVDILYSKYVFWLRKPEILISIEQTETL